MKRSRSGPATESTARRTLLQRRHAVTLACFLATLSAYVERVGFSIAYTAMAKVANIDEATKGTVLSAFYWGYGVSQVLLWINQCSSCILIAIIISSMSGDPAASGAMITLELITNMHISQPALVSACVHANISVHALHK